MNGLPVTMGTVVEGNHLFGILEDFVHHLIRVSVVLQGIAVLSCLYH